MSTVTYLDRLLAPVVEVFTPAPARKIVDLRADPEIACRIVLLVHFSPRTLTMIASGFCRRVLSTEREYMTHNP